MSQDIYRDLARRLDAIPNGFPATESGSELRLLAKIFTPEEAALASQMRYGREPAADIAARAGIDPKTARRLLKTMVRKGLVRYRKAEGQFIFGLRPFVVGFYEEQLPWMDAEMAALFEAYFQETQGLGINTPGPSLQRVIPVGEAIPFDLEIYPYERATEMIENAKSWGVRKCICRLQQRLIGEGCDHEIENCLVFAPVEGLFVNSEWERAIDKEEALRILGETEEAGLVHSTGNYRDGLSYICNCCSCCCAILRSLTEFDVPTAVARSDFQAIVDTDLCLGCGDCVARCQFGALAVLEDVCEVDHARCVGCGVCAIVCPVDALQLERRPESEAQQMPADIKEWMNQRAEERGISMADVL
jgi:electron transport complex protein RnfB